MAAALTRDGKGRMTDGATCYRVPGYPHLRVEPCYDDPDDEYDGKRRRAHLYAWVVIDERFSVGLDRHRRWQVVTYRTLAQVRSWVRAGGPDVWDPERRVEDRSWQPDPYQFTYTDDPSDPCPYCVLWQHPEDQPASMENIEDHYPVLPDGSVARRVYRRPHDSCEGAVSDYVDQGVG